MNKKININPSSTKWLEKDDRVVADYFCDLGFRSLKQILDMRVFDLMNMQGLNAVRVEEVINSYISSWREADREQWNQARWFNGMDAAQTADENKTIVCGHWHTSYGHSKYEHKGTEFGEDADFSPYYGPGIIAIDACTAFSGKSNCLVIED